MAFRTARALQMLATTAMLAVARYVLKSIAGGLACSALRMRTCVVGYRGLQAVEKMGAALNASEVSTSARLSHKLVVDAGVLVIVVDSGGFAMDLGGRLMLTVSE